MSSKHLHSSEPVQPLVFKPLPEIKIDVEQKDGTNKNYTCVMDVNAAIKFEESTGLDVANPEVWKTITRQQLITVIWAELDQYHPEVELREVRQWFSPARSAALWLALVEQIFPGSAERLAKLVPEDKPADAPAEAQASE